MSNPPDLEGASGLRIVKFEKHGASGHAAQWDALTEWGFYVEGVAHDLLPLLQWDDFVTHRHARELPGTPQEKTNVEFMQCYAYNELQGTH